jgi:hypothetical protein
MGHIPLIYIARKSQNAVMKILLDMEYACRKRSFGAAALIIKREKVYFEHTYCFSYHMRACVETEDSRSSLECSIDTCYTYFLILMRLIQPQESTTTTA